jgi:hypothetical protein
MLALIPLTIALGVSASAISGLSAQIVSFSYFYGTKEVATSALDTLIKTPGDPPDWNQSYIPQFNSIGLAQYSYIDMYRDTRTVSNALDRYKLIALHLNRSNPNIIKALRELTGGRNIAIISESPDAELNFSVAWYKQSDGSWVATNDTAAIEAALSQARDVFSVTRVVRSITKTLETAEFIWNYTGTDIVQSSPVIGDIDCDGKNEIVVATNSPPGGTMALEGNGTLIWFYPTGKAYTSSPALVDLDGDCGLEVVVGEAKLPGENEGVPSNITVLDSDGSLMWYYTLDSSTWNAPAIADVDIDGQIEVVITDMYNNATTPDVYGEGAKVYVLNGKDGSVERTYNSCDLPTGVDCSNNRHRFKGGVIIADLDHNAANGLEIIAATDIGYVFALHGKDMSLYWMNNSDLEEPPTLPKVHIHSLPAAADMDGDGWVEVAYADKNGVHIINGTSGNYICHNYFKDTYGAVDKSALAIADLDLSNDGNLEMVVGTSNGYVVAFDNQCNIIWTYNTNDEDVESSPAIADIDDDCKLEVVIGTGKPCKEPNCPDFTPTHVIALNAEDGSLLWSQDTQGGIVSSPAIGDLDGDGDMEIVVGSDSGDVYTFDITGYGDGWPSFHQAEYFMDSHNVRRRGEWDGSVCGAPSGGYYSIEVRSRVTATITVVVWE